MQKLPDTREQTRNHVVSGRLSVCCSALHSQQEAAIDCDCFFGGKTANYFPFDIFLCAIYKYLRKYLW